MKKNNLCAESERDVSVKKKSVIIKELVKGQKSATQLKILLEKNPFGSKGSFCSSEELMANMLRPFTESLSILNSSSSADEVAPHRNSDKNVSPVTGSDEQRSRKGGGRGRYNRRRSAVTWSILSCTIDDNHAWRKYGQKRILNSEFPRSYFRCSHKYGRACGATKQVQVHQENPNMYQTTYIGHHTCINNNNGTTPMATQHYSTIAGSSSSTPSAWESYLLNLDHDSPNKVPNIVQDDINSSPSRSAVKQGFSKASDVTDHHQQHMLDPNLWSDLKDSQPFKPTIMPLKMEESHNNNNAYSCIDSQRLDMDFEVPSIHFDTDLFHFD